jgi:hypothetical protein
MFSMVTGFPVNIDKASEERTICPPPSPREPSIVTWSGIENPK